MEPSRIDHHREYLSPPHLGFKVRSPWGHPGSRASFCLLDQRGEKEVLLELCQVFEVTVTLISGLVKLVFSCQTYTWALCLKCAANKPGFKTESKQYALRMHQKSSLIHHNKSSAFYCWGTWDNPKRISWPSWKHRGESSCGSDSKDCPIKNSTNPPRFFPLSSVNNQGQETKDIVNHIRLNTGLVNLIMDFTYNPYTI